MELTLYELLGLIKDNKAPKKIRRNGNDYEFSIVDGDIDYIAIDKEPGVNCYLSDVIGENYLGFIFSTTVEILEEEKEIEEFNYFNNNKFINTPNGMTKTDRNHLDSNFEEIRLQINNIKRELNKIKKEGK